MDKIDKFDATRITEGDTIVCKNNCINSRYSFDWTKSHILYNNDICRVFYDYGGDIECTVDDIDFVVYKESEE